MKRTAAAALLATTTFVLIVSSAWTAPTPPEVPASWLLDITLDTPKAIDVVLPGQFTPKRFWYVRYTVTNRTGEDRIFVPEFVLYTDTGEILRAGQKVPSAVFREIKTVCNDPLLKDTTEITGKLLQGEDNAQDGVAIWTDFDPKAGLIDLFVGGLSGETEQIDLPTPIQEVQIDTRGGEKVVEKTKAILSRTLQVTYKIAGEAAARPQVKPELVLKEWVMR